MSIAPHPDPETLAELLHSTAIRLLRSVRRVDESSGLTAPRLSALSVIVFNGPITLGKLAEAEQVRPPTMTRIVNALVQKALVVKAQDPADGRVILISATTSGVHIRQTVSLTISAESVPATRTSIARSVRAPCARLSAT